MQSRVTYFLPNRRIILFVVLGWVLQVFGGALKGSLAGCECLQVLPSTGIGICYLVKARHIQMVYNFEDNFVYCCYYD